MVIRQGKPIYRGGVFSWFFWAIISLPHRFCETLFFHKTQEIVRAVLIAFGNKNLFPEFKKRKVILADGTVVKERLKTSEDKKLLLVTINNLLKEIN